MRCICICVSILAIVMQCIAVTIKTDNDSRCSTYKSWYYPLLHVCKYNANPFIHQYISKLCDDVLFCWFFRKNAFFWLIKPENVFLNVVPMWKSILCIRISSSNTYVAVAARKANKSTINGPIGHMWNATRNRSKVILTFSLHKVPRQCG